MIAVIERSIVGEPLLIVIKRVAEPRSTVPAWAAEPVDWITAVPVAPLRNVPNITSPPKTILPGFAASETRLMLRNVTPPPLILSRPPPASTCVVQAEYAAVPEIV